MSIYENFSQTELDILQARAARVAAATDKDRQIDELSTLVVHVRGEVYGLPVDHLTSVYDDVSVTPVPCTPAFVSGIANLRGHIVPVLELGELLNVPGSKTTTSKSLVVASNDQMTIAFHVDVIGDVLATNRDEVSPVPASLSGEQSTYIIGILPGDIALVDMDALLTDPALVVSETIV